MSPRQDIRLSQFITTYGPGAIIEGPGGPAIIPLVKIGLFEHINTLRPSDFEIRECMGLTEVLRRQVGMHVRLFEIPTNQKLDRETPIYRTKPFPEWHLCYLREKHKYAAPILYKGNKCPECGQHDHRNAVRFVMACKKGHLDDVDWERAVHCPISLKELKELAKKDEDKAREILRDSTCKRARGRAPYFYWFREGPTLRDIRIKCAFCGKSRSMGEIYYYWTVCTRRFPEREKIFSRPARGDFEFEGEVLHRGALNLRIPIVYSAVSVPPTRSELEILLMQENIRLIIRTLIAARALNKETLERALKDAHISEHIINRLMKYDIEQILTVMEELERAGERPQNYDELIQSEFKALKTIADGKYIPPEDLEDYDFEVSLSDIKYVETENGAITFRIVPIARLTVIMTQYGYVRVDPVEGKPVAIYDIWDDTAWFPAVRLKGEGIFIDMQDSKFTPQGRAAREWLALFNKYGRGGGDYSDHLFRNPSRRIEMHPLFVWWHTLAHRLIMWLAIDSGYPAASIRERVYCDGSSGGILLYTSQPGSGGLGGFIGLMDHIEKILKNAYISAMSCSNDPFCREITVRAGSYAGAACYACLLLPETSCEHRNMWLDRRLLIENPLWRRALD